jgi:serine phosphatase RsbU (regulator of sigma subunit)
MMTLGKMVGQYFERQSAEQAVVVSEMQKSGILRGVASAVVVVDVDGKFLFANDAAASFYGLATGEDVVAAGREYVLEMFEFLDEDGVLAPADAPAFRALGGSIDSTSSLLQMRPRAGGDVRWLQAKSTPALSEDGVASIIVVFDDVTSQRALDVELRRSRDELQTILEGVADAITATDANGNIIYLNRAALDALGFASKEELVQAAGQAPEQILATINILDEEGFPIDLAKDDPGAIVRSGVADHAEATWRYHHQQRGDSWALVRATAIRDAQGKLLMVLSISEDITAQKEREGKLRVIAETLQASILPASLPPIPGIELGAAFTPRGGDFHEVGGDFYDVFALSDGQWLMLTGDVCGKGPEAAAVTSLCRYALRALALREPSPAALLGDLNEVMLRHHTDGRFATVAICRLGIDDDGAHALLALGGHPQPLVLHTDGSVETVGLPGTLVGAVRVEKFGEEASVHLQPGDALIFYTDGVTEARNNAGEMFDLQAFLGQCQGERAEEMARNIQQAVLTHQGERVPYDDVAILIARVSSDHVLRQRFPAESVSVPQVRELLETLDDRYPQLAWDEIKLMATELVTNSIIHGQGDHIHEWLELVISEHEQSLRISIIGGGEPFSERAQWAAPAAVSGRGLMMVDTLADRWGVDNENGVCVWFECDLAPDEADSVSVDVATDF